MDNEWRERDLIWCRALVAVLDVDQVSRVTAEFNRIRPDKAVENRVEVAGLTPEQFSEFMRGYVKDVMTQVEERAVNEPVEYEGIPCTCIEDGCEEVICKGECGCMACMAAHGDSMDDR